MTRNTRQRCHKTGEVTDRQGTRTRGVELGALDDVDAAAAHAVALKDAVEEEQLPVRRAHDGRIRSGAGADAAAGAHDLHVDVVDDEPRLALCCVKERSADVQDALRGRRLRRRADGGVGGAVALHAVWEGSRQVLQDASFDGELAAAAAAPLAALRRSVCGALAAWAASWRGPSALDASACLGNRMLKSGTQDMKLQGRRSALSALRIELEWLVYM